MISMAHSIRIFSTGIKIRELPYTDWFWFVVTGWRSRRGVCCNRSTGPNSWSRRRRRSHCLTKYV